MTLIYLNYPPAAAYLVVMDKLIGPYVGLVESNKDPEKLGRIKASCAHAYGVPNSQAGGIGINDLPWAVPAGLPAGGSAQSGGMDWLPDPGDQVLLFFLDGEPEKPVWMWLMQTVDQSKDFKLHQYEGTTTVGAPKRAGMTRYGHTIELNSGSIIMATKSGYSILLNNGGAGQNNGLILMSTPKGQMLEFDDMTDGLTINVTRDIQQVVGGQWLSFSDSIDFTTLTGNCNFEIGQSMRIDIVKDFILGAAGNGEIDILGNLDMTVGGNHTVDVTGDYDITTLQDATFKFATLKLGQAPTEPFVLGNQLTQLMNILLLWLAGHTHSNGDNGSPTGPPIIPPQPEVSVQLAKILSEVITGQ